MSITHSNLTSLSLGCGFLDICHYNGAMKHFGKDRGEEKLRLPGNRSIRVDGYVQEEKTIFEFYGCYWQSCPKCCLPHGKHEYKQLSFQFLFNQTMNRENSIKERGWKLQSIWECEWRKEIEEDPETSKLFKLYVQPNIPVVKPNLNLRKAMKGGRVDCIHMLWDSFEPLHVPMRGMDKC